MWYISKQKTNARGGDEFMTDRRPDIHCSGCGKYCYSLSHRPHEQKFPTVHYCTECADAIKRGIRSGLMLDHAWYIMFGTVHQQLQQVRTLSPADISTIGSFSWTMRGLCIPSERKFEGVNKMSIKEWKEIAKEKLAYFKRYCNKKEFTLLNTLVAVAH